MSKVFSREEISSAYADFQVLVWRDLRVFRNTTRTISREPLRLLGWLVWFGYIAYRLIPHHRARVISASGSLDAMDIGAAILVFVMSLSLMRGEQPPVPFFSSASEARWLANAPLRSWVTTLYLQLRNAVARFPSMMVFLAYIITVSPPSHNPLLILIGITTIVAMLLLTRLFAMPREFAPPLLKFFMIGVGALLAVLSAVSAIQAFLAVVPFHVPFVGALPPVHIGYLFIWGIQGDPRLWLASYALVAVAFLAGSGMAQNRYPELYELSVAGWEARRRFREGRYSEREEQSTIAPTRALGNIPSGAATQLWVNWLMYRRDKALWWICARPILAFFLGFGCIAVHNNLLDVLRAFGTLIVLTTMLSSAIDATRIGKELRRTIYWLTDTNFRTRLTMIVFGWYWRSAGDLALFALGTLIAGSEPYVVLRFVLIALCAVWLQRCISAAAFAILPNKADLGGPTYLVRVLLMVLFSMPPIVTGVVLNELKEPIAFTITISLAITLFESAILLTFAAKRLRGRFDLVVGY